MKGLAIGFLTLVLATSALCEQNDPQETVVPPQVVSQSRAVGPFPDVDHDHWAYEAVHQLANLGIIKGYPDGKYHGDRYVTRFELAIVLTRLVEAMNAALLPEQKEPAGDGTAVLQGKSLDDAEKKPCEWLVYHGFVNDKSPIIREPNELATGEDVSTSLASVVARILERRIPSDQIMPNEQHHAEE